MERTEKLMMKAIIRYREDRDLENAIDFIQKKVKKKWFSDWESVFLYFSLLVVSVLLLLCLQFQCCGVESNEDWNQNVYFECSDTNPSLEACGVPFSCCVHLQNQVRTTVCLQLVTEGCLDARGLGSGQFPETRNSQFLVFRFHVKLQLKPRCVATNEYLPD